MKDQQEFESRLNSLLKQKSVEMKSAEESLGISSEEYNKIVDKCIFEGGFVEDFAEVNHINPSEFDKRHWIDFDMIISEIRYHRNNVQGRISEFKKNENPSALDRHRYYEALGEESVLMCLQAWCYDFKFSSDEVKEIIKKKEEQQ